MRTKVITIAINRNFNFDISDFIKNLISQFDFREDEIFKTCITGSNDFVGYKNQPVILLFDHFKYTTDNSSEAQILFKLASGASICLDTYRDNFGLHRVFSQAKLIVLTTQNPFPYYLDINLPALHSLPNCIIYIFTDLVKISRALIDPFSHRTRIVDPLNISWKSRVDCQIPKYSCDIAHFIDLDKFTNFKFNIISKYV